MSFESRLLFGSDQEDIGYGPDKYRSSYYETKREKPNNNVEGMGHASFGGSFGPRGTGLRTGFAVSYSVSEAGISK